MQTIQNILFLGQIKFQFFLIHFKILHENIHIDSKNKNLHHGISHL
jgi:hypothetical protein